MSEIQRYAAIVEYNGRCFHGWQKQKHHNNELSVQAALEAAISLVANHPVDVACAGRTDAGVHATRQVIHFDSHARRSNYGWIMGINTNSPPEVSIQWLEPVSADFHARFKAKARCYRYFINNAPYRQALQHDQMTWWKYPLDADRMHEAAQALLGTHDFSAFRAKDCQAKTPIKTMHRIGVKRWGNLIMLELEASAFLYHMVRNIVGVLLPIGEGHKPVEWMADVLASQSRVAAGITAPGDGLHFVGVRYPEEFAIPSDPWGPMMIEPLLAL
ncbi:tRNA pseudouridine(38-40) synthase TruA [Parathalassolituus penaei]|uniref:tRNA pseudouridine synthase A n=1 Tax=Parathalassolituus penaei TaxID=2997323 RepID=A0A9X3EH36_9GAMM|nr:tRNA pseudouridine(38-40) synthase TruA [Parathalassolituus penaei]MCY0966595.1 tRNA pseudouridine(38-40) synthase TruA [Parathalassolituus penaei]